MVFCSHKTILLDPLHSILQNVMMTFNFLDFGFSLTVERKIDGFILKQLSDCALIYAKGWMFIDVMALIGMVENNKHTSLFNNFHQSVRENRIKQEIEAVENLNYYFDTDFYFYLLLFPKMF